MKYFLSLILSSILSLILGTLLYMLLRFLEDLHKGYSIKEVKDLVSDLLSDIHADQLRFYLIHAMDTNKIPENYRICSDEEWNYANDILADFKKYLSKAFFNDELYVPKSRYAVESRDFFMYFLNIYLHKRLSNDRIFRDNTFKGVISHTEGTTVYELSVLGITLYKMRYISSLYCLNSDVLNHKKDYYVNEQGFKDIIDSKQTEYFSYRP